MDRQVPRLVPKIHPANRAVEQDDPMTLHATPVSGDPDAMVEALVEEYSRMGWGTESILQLFRDPAYPMLQGLWKSLGELEVRRRIEDSCRRHGGYQFRATIWEAPEEPEPELVQIGPVGPEGGRHADRQ